MLYSVLIAWWLLPLLLAILLCIPRSGFAGPSSGVSVSVSESKSKSNSSTIATTAQATATATATAHIKNPTTATAHIKNPTTATFLAKATAASATANLSSAASSWKTGGGSSSSSITRNYVSPRGSIDVVITYVDPSDTIWQGQLESFNYSYDKNRFSTTNEVC